MLRYPIKAKEYTYKRLPKFQYPSHSKISLTFLSYVSNGNLRTDNAQPFSNNSPK